MYESLFRCPGYLQVDSNRGGTSDQGGFPVFICHGFTTNKLSYYIILGDKDVSILGPPYALLLGFKLRAGTYCWFFFSGCIEVAESAPPSRPVEASRWGSSTKLSGSRWYMWIGYPPVN